MAKRKKKATKKKATRKSAGRRTKKKAPADFIISKSRTKNAAGINVSGEFYAALDEAVRGLIATTVVMSLAHPLTRMRGVGAGGGV